jgi:hypothetical protein
MLRTYPPRSTPLTVVDTRRLRVLRSFTLRGYWALDAISPTGRWLYLIHYTSPSNALRYEVRAYDLRRQRLVTEPVVDPREPSEAMRGMAVTRAMSADGRWAYTLYIRPGGGKPFVHALDTAGRTARCVDLPADLASMDISKMHLKLDDGGRTLSLDGSGERLATVDTRTFAVRRPAAAPAVRPPATPRETAARSDGGGAWPWALTAIPLLGFAAVLVSERRRRLRSTTPVR